MFISKLSLPNRKAFQVLGVSDYIEHQAIWDLFADDPDRRRDFLYRKMNQPRIGYIVVSKRPPIDRGGFWKIETKKYEPDLRIGQKLSFSLRVNPVRTGKNDNGKHARFDVVMDEKVRLRESAISEQDKPTLGEIAHNAGKNWLLQRTDKLGIKVDDSTLRVSSYRQVMFEKKNRKVKIATLDFDGTLTVVEPDALRDALFKGIGPAKSFGCGLLLVKRL